MAFSKFLKRAIEVVGPSNVLQVVTDNATNCKKPLDARLKRYSNISFGHLVFVHSLNFMFKDKTQDLYWMNDTYRREKAIMKYFIPLKRNMKCRETFAKTTILNSWRDRVKFGMKIQELMGQSVRYN